MALAKACREVRWIMLQASPCHYSALERGNIENACPYSRMVGTLDTLQRDAYFQIRAIVRFALGSRLYAELIHMVTEQIMEAEDIGSDPRTIVHGKVSTRLCKKKYYFPCEHDPGRLESSSRISYTSCYVSSAKYQDILPKCVHEVASYEKLDLKERQVKEKVIPSKCNDDLSDFMAGALEDIEPITYYDSD